MHTVSSAELWSFLVEEKDDSLAHYSVFPFRSSRVQKHIKLFISIVIFSTGSVVAPGGVLDLVPDWVVPYGDVSYVPAKTPELNWWELEVHHRPLVWNKCKTLVLFTLSPFILFFFIKLFIVKRSFMESGIIFTSFDPSVKLLNHCNCDLVQVSHPNQLKVVKSVL